MLVLLLACTSDDGTTEALSDFASAIDDAEAVVTAHADAVSAATTVDEVTTLEVAYADDWGAQSQMLADAAEMVSGCAMDEDDMASMDDVTLATEDLDALVSDHTAEHASHTDVSECTAAETAHGTSMSADFETLRGAHDTWADSIECSMSGMEM